MPKKSKIMGDGIDHDRRVEEVMLEMARSAEFRSPGRWKVYFREKGYLDDEIDLANAFFQIQFPLERGRAFLLLALYFIFGVLASIALYLLAKKAAVDQMVDLDVRGWNTVVWTFSLGSILLFGPFIRQFLRIRYQFDHIFWKVLRTDFSALKVQPSAVVTELKRAGSQTVASKIAECPDIIVMDYDKRRTFVGELRSYPEKGWGFLRERRLLVIQEGHKDFPAVQAYRKGILPARPRREVRLEGGFERHYKVCAETPQDAFYVMNPRVMDALLDSEILDSIHFFESAGQYRIMVFPPIDLKTPMRLHGPMLRYDDYKAIKNKLLHVLDIMSDINDVLSRQIVDDGSMRSEAKNK